MLALRSEQVESVLGSKGLRATSPRREIIHLVASQRRTFTAEDLCAEMPHIGRATVYRTLRMLQETNIICKVVMPGNDMAYSAAEGFGGLGSDDDEHHHHVICEECGDVRPFATQAVEDVINMLSNAPQIAIGEVQDHRMEIYDICPRCLGSPAAEANQ